MMRCDCSFCLNRCARVAAADARRYQEYAENRYERKRQRYLDRRETKRQARLVSAYAEERKALEWIDIGGEG